MKEREDVKEEPGKTGFSQGKTYVNGFLTRAAAVRQCLH